MQNAECRVKSEGCLVGAAIGRLLLFLTHTTK